MKVRRKARELALQALFYMDASKNFSQEKIALFSETLSPPAEALSFFTQLVEGVCVHLSKIDEEIARYAKNWKPERMQSVDRNILRIAIFEFLHHDDIPKKVILNEAIDLAKKFGGENSSRFINGVLGQMYTSLEKKE